ESSNKDKENKISEILKYHLRNNKYILNVQLITNTNQVINGFDETLPHIGDNFKEKIKPANIAIYDDIVKNQNGDNMIVLGKRLYNYNTGYFLGYMYIYINESSITSTYEDVVTSGTDIFIINRDKILSHADSSNVGKVMMLPYEIKDNRRIDDTVYRVHNLNIDTNPELDLKIISMMSYEHLYSFVGELKGKITLIIIVAILLSLLLSFIISNSLIRSINELKNKMELFVSGRADNVRFKFRELAALEKSFDKMVFEINNLIEKNNEEKEKQRIAEMKALQAQINPHFIYNALDAIQWHAKLKKQTYIADMIYALSSFFRISLHKGDSVIKVWEEVKYVKSYMEIEKMRFPDLFDVIYHVDDEILECNIPKIVLQPMFENAIKHGFEDMEEGGLIILTGYRDKDGDVMFEIEDNGKGLEFDPLSAERKSSGYGVRNVQERLILEYGDGYGLTYHSIKGECTWVGVKIKFSK
ncbi:MAG: histidine kinase, partial [Oscillospiraceae bacterium]